MAMKIVAQTNIKVSDLVNGYLNDTATTTPDNLQMLCHSCNLDKLNKPFDKVAEERRLQEIYSMTDDEIAALPEGGKG